jgi:hypothetical protein
MRFFGETLGPFGLYGSGIGGWIWIKEKGNVEGEIRDETSVSQWDPQILLIKSSNTIG